MKNVGAEMQVLTDDSVKAAAAYNEAEVRFHIIDPIIRSLGYPGGDDVYLTLEEKLEYPYVHIGGRSKRDLPLGFPDYRAGLKGARGSFIIEAKAGSLQITSKEVEQAHSYAAHAQVGANYFVLCNGKAIAVYETLSGANAPPITSIPLCQVNKRFHELENILAPASLARNCQIKYDTKLKLTEGLGSSVRIRSGHYGMAEYEYRFIMDGEDRTEQFLQLFPQLSIIDQQLNLLKTSFDLRVSGGTAERSEDGRITARVEFTGATTHNHQAMTILGINEATFVTADKFVSVESDSPTIFESITNFAVSKGTVMPQLFGTPMTMESDVFGNMFVKVAMYYKDGKMQGQYIALSDQAFSVPGVSPIKVELDVAGAFELTVDPL